MRDRTEDRRCPLTLTLSPVGGEGIVGCAAQIYRFHSLRGATLTGRAGAHLGGAILGAFTRNLDVVGGGQRHAHTPPLIGHRLAKQAQTGFRDTQCLVHAVKHHGGRDAQQFKPRAGRQLWRQGAQPIARQRQLLQALAATDLGGQGVDPVVGEDQPAQLRGQ